MNDGAGGFGTKTDYPVGIFPYFIASAMADLTWRCRAIEIMS
jgi:hypothetical protein